MQIFILVTVSLVEIILFFLILRFFSRLRRSEELLTRLRDGQESLLDKLATNAELERELVHSFHVRQTELRVLNDRMEQKITELSTLLEQAEAVSRSPHFLRELVIAGKKKGRSSQQLAKATGLSVDEIELILLQAGKQGA